MPLTCNANQSTGFCVIQIFTNFYSFSKQAGYRNLDFILVIPRNIFKLHTENIHTRDDKIYFYKKIFTQIILAKRSLELNGLGLLCYSRKRMSLLIRVQIDSSFSLYIIKAGTWWNFRTLVMDKFARLFAFWHPIFERQKRSDRESEACCNSRHWLLHLGSLCNNEKIVIIKIHKLLYF